VGGKRGPVRDVVADPAFLDFQLAPGVAFEHAVTAGHTVLVYVVTGSGRIGPAGETAVHEGQLAVLGDGDSVSLQSGEGGLRVLLFSAHPLREPVAWYGPIVMNTQVELETAFDELQNNTFVKHKA
jgi:hypothetical protein